MDERKNSYFAREFPAAGGSYWNQIPTSAGWLAGWLIVVGG